MAHEFESGFLTREKAWHGLGTIVQEAPTSADAIRLAELDWSVVQQPVFVNGLEVPNYKANVRDRDNTVLGIVTNKYKIVQNQEAFDFTDSLLGQGVRYETAGSLKNGKTIWLLAKTDNVKILGDEIEPYMCFTNSHDGTGAVKVFATPVRVVCNNTLNLALSGASRCWSARHIGDISAKRAEAVQSLKLFGEYMTELNKEAESLATQKISKDQIDKILDDMFTVDADDSDRKKANVEAAKETFYVCYFSQDLINYLGTKYGVVNAMADMVDHRVPARLTQNYAENNFSRVINGHVLLDEMYARVKEI